MIALVNPGLLRLDGVKHLREESQLGLKAIAVAAKEADRHPGKLLHPKSTQSAPASMARLQSVRAMQSKYSREMQKKSSNSRQSALTTNANRVNFPISNGMVSIVE